MLNWTRDSHEGESRADAAAVSQQDVASQHAPALCQNPALGLQGDFTVFNKTLHLVITHVSKELILYFFPPSYLARIIFLSTGKKEWGKH